MHTKVIEDIISKELKGLCINCENINTCIYFKTATRKIIQCELFVLDKDQCAETTPLNGLCKTCDHSATCTLPGRKSNVWRCSEYL